MLCNEDVFADEDILTTNSILFCSALLYKLAARRTLYLVRLKKNQFYQQRRCADFHDSSYTVYPAGPAVKFSQLYSLIQLSFYHDILALPAQREDLQRRLAELQSCPRRTVPAELSLQNCPDSRQRAADSRQRTADSRQRTADRRQKTDDRRQSTALSSVLSPGNTLPARFQFDSSSR